MDFEYKENFMNLTSNARGVKVKLNQWDYIKKKKKTSAQKDQETVLEAHLCPRCLTSRQKPEDSETISSKLQS